MLKKLTLIVVALSALNFCLNQEESNVIQLTDANFKEILEKYDYLMIEFYAPWCGHCKTLEPVYAEAAGLLSKTSPQVRLAKIDATTNLQSATQHQVEGFPTIKFYTKATNQFVDYNGGRTVEAIVNWINKKIGPATKELKNVEELEAFISSHEVAVVLSDKNHIDLFNDVALAYEDLAFGHIFTGENMGIVLYKKFDEGQVYFPKDKEVTKESLLTFISTHSVPLVSNFTERIIDEVFEKNQSGFFYIRPKDNNHDDLVRKVAEKNKGKGLFFIACDSEDDLEKQLMEYYGLENKDLPHIRITQVISEEDVRNYIYEVKEFTLEAIEKFVEDFFSGKLQPYYKSEEIPTEQQGPVHVVVGKTFIKDVIENPKHVFVEFYAPWCGHCKKLAPVWEELAKKYQNHEDVLIAKMDASANEAEGVSIDGYPTIKAYTRADKKNPKEFQGNNKLEDLVMFVEHILDPSKPSPPPRGEQEEDPEDELLGEVDEDSGDNKGNASQNQQGDNQSAPVNTEQSQGQEKDQHVEL